MCGIPRFARITGGGWPMPWNNPTQYPFTHSSIKANAPASSGVYALYDSRRAVYFGESGNIQARLLQHLTGDNPCIVQMKPTTFSYEPVTSHQRLARQNELIRESRPICNQ